MRAAAGAAPRAAVKGVFLALSLLLPGCGERPELVEPVPLFDDVPIEYPLDLWDRGVEGTTLLRVLVGVDGGVDSVTVLESSGHEAMDSSAVDGARLLRFEPARRGEETVEVWAQVPVHFTRDESGTPP